MLAGITVQLQYWLRLCWSFGIWCQQILSSIDGILPIKSDTPVSSKKQKQKQKKSFPFELFERLFFSINLF